MGTGGLPEGEVVAPGQSRSFSMQDRPADVDAGVVDEVPGGRVVAAVQHAVVGLHKGNSIGLDEQMEGGKGGSGEGHGVKGSEPEQSRMCTVVMPCDGAILICGGGRGGIATGCMAGLTGLMPSLWTSTATVGLSPLQAAAAESALWVPMPASRWITCGSHGRGAHQAMPGNEPGLRECRVGTCRNWENRRAGGGRRGGGGVADACRCRLLSSTMSLSTMPSRPDGFVIGEERHRRRREWHSGCKKAHQETAGCQFEAAQMHQGYLQLC